MTFIHPRRVTQSWKRPGSVEPPAPESDGSPFVACDPQNQACQVPQLSHIPDFLHLNPLLEKPEKRSVKKGAERKDPGSVATKESRAVLNLGAGTAKPCL